VVDLIQHTSPLPSFLEGSETPLTGRGTDIAFADFSQFKSQAIQVSADRTAVTISLPKAQLELARHADLARLPARRGHLRRSPGALIAPDPRRRD